MRTRSKKVTDWLAQSNRLWLVWLALVNGTVSVMSLTYPGMMGSPAYGWALVVLPLPIWGFIMAVIAAMAIFSLVFGSREASILAMALSFWVQFMFGLSILALTLGGTISAISGAFQWWTMSVVNMKKIVKGEF